MHNHWDVNLEVKNLVLEYKPKLIVECGAGSGENTLQYLSLKYDFNLVVISDGELPENLKGYVASGKLEWIYGVSYIELEKFANESIDFCSIDTDHNYWTLNRELEVLKRKMKPEGIVVVHDTQTYRQNSGHMNSYDCKVAYPPEIVECEEKGKMYGDAINEVLASSNFHILKENYEKNGAIALQKKRKEK